MTIELPTGVTVRVEFPSLPYVCQAPEAPQPGGVTVPVQGSLTAEQLAHIVATVTAKVVEELGGQPGTVTWEAVQDKPTAFPPEQHEHPIDQIDGLRTSLDGLASDVANRSEIGHRHNASDIDDLPSGGGAGIDDTTIGTDTTWSSQKTSDELAGKADAIITLVDMETGEEIAAIPIADAISGTYYLATKAMGFNAGPLGIRLNSEVEVNDHLPPLPAPNAIYAVRNPETGVITWHMPTLGG